MGLKVAVKTRERRDKRDNRTEQWYNNMYDCRIYKVRFGVTRWTGDDVCERRYDARGVWQVSVTAHGMLCG